MAQRQRSFIALMLAATAAGGCGSDARPSVLGAFDPRGAEADDAPPTPVVLEPLGDGPRCGRWFCADQLPQSGSAVAVGDFDGDGRPDILLADTGRLLSTLGPLALLHNDGGMRFSDATRAAGLQGYGAWSAVFGDLDNDGDADLVLGGRRAGEPAAESGDVLVFYNDGAGRFAPPLVVPRWGAGVPLAIDLADLNADGRLDILASLSGTNLRETYAPRVLESQVDGRFVAQPGGLNDEGFAWVTLATDLNGDQRPDVLTAHDGNAIHQGSPGEAGVVGCTAPEGPHTASWLNAAYCNDGTAGDIDLSVLGAGAFWTSPYNTPMSLVAGDFDADGRMDLFTTQTGNPVLFSVSASGQLQDRPDWPGAWRREVSDDRVRGVGWGGLARDLDRDGDVDALVAYGVIPTNTATWPNTVYLNGGAAGLGIAPAGTGFERAGAWSALATGDFDGDGDDDFVLGAQTLFLGPCATAPRALLLTNESAWPGRHWLRVRLVGTVSNREGLGARVEASNGDVTMVREISRGGSTMSSSSRVADFGLGAASSVGILRVRWPSGALQTLRNVQGDREITLREPQWLTVDAPMQPAGGVATVRLSAAVVNAIGGLTGAVSLELRGQGRWVTAPALEAATGDLVGRFAGAGKVWVRTVGARAGLRAAAQVLFH